MAILSLLVMLECAGRRIQRGRPSWHPEIRNPARLVGELAFERLSVEEGFLGAGRVVRVAGLGRRQLLVVDLGTHSAWFESGMC